MPGRSPLPSRALPRRLATATAMLVVLLVAAAAPAAATTGGDFTVTLNRSPSGTPTGGSADFAFADTSTSTTMLLMRGNTELARSTAAAGNTRVSALFTTLTSGDRVEIYKPGIPAGPPAVSPTDQYTIPTASVSGAAGAVSVSGSAPEGALARVLVNHMCNESDEQSLPVVAPGGNFVAPTLPLARGTELSLFVYSGAGDYTRYRTNVEGETACFYAYANPFPEQPTLDPAVATPYTVGVSNLLSGVALTSRLVWKRGGTTIADVTDSGNPGFSTKSATQPLPGDVLEIYRPQTALTPSQTVTIPTVSGIVDAGSSLVAFDSSVATGHLDVFAADDINSQHSSRRSFLNLPPGRTLIDFKKPQGDNRAFTMVPGGRAFLYSNNADWTIQYGFLAAPGDLVAPVLSAKFKSRLRLSKIKKSISVRLTSNEGATGTATLLVAKRLPGKGHPKTRPGSRTFKFASAKLSLSAGSRTVKLKLSKSGLKALKKLRGAGRSMRDVKATLQLKLTDASGNSSVTTRTMKLVAR